MRRQLLIAVAATITLTACSEPDVAAPTNTVSAKEVQEPTLQQTDPEAYHNNIESAMAEIPPEMRLSFQRLFVCEARKNSQSASPKPIDAEYIRTLTAYLKANPSAGDTCSSTNQN